MMTTSVFRRRILLVLAACFVLAGCAPSEPEVLRLATTTSTYDSGLLDAILPVFEKAYNARVDVVAVGTGQALELGKNGDADVVLVHSRASEDQFVADGYGLVRYDVMYNDYIVVGPGEDPAKIKGLSTGKEALAAMSAAKAEFVSRGDDSGTHKKELSLWKDAGIQPDPESGWYSSIGQGMGETLQFANERKAYTLSDRGTYLAQLSNLPNLVVLVGGQSIAENPDPKLLNPYGLIPVNPDMHEGIKAELAQKFVDWMTSLKTQQLIADFGVDKYGQPLFYADSEAWRQAHP